MFKKLIGPTCRFIRRLWVSACTCDLRHSAKKLASYYSSLDSSRKKDELQHQLDSFTRKGDDPKKVIEHFEHLRNEKDPLESAGEIQPNSVKSVKL